MEERFETFTVLIAKISRAIRKIKTQEMAGFHLKSPHVSCLYYLYKERALTASALCERCEEDKASISRSLGQLEKSGFIHCPLTDKKKYNAPLTLTDKGVQIGKYITEKIDEVLEMASEGLSEENRKFFMRVWR